MYKRLAIVEKIIFVMMLTYFPTIARGESQCLLPENNNIVTLQKASNAINTHLATPIPLCRIAKSSISDIHYYLYIGDEQWNECYFLTNFCDHISKTDAKIRSRSERRCMIRKMNQLINSRKCRRGEIDSRFNERWFWYYFDDKPDELMKITF